MKLFFGLSTTTTLNLTDMEKMHKCTNSKCPMFSDFYDNDTEEIPEYVECSYNWEFCYCIPYAKFDKIRKRKH